MNPHLSFVNNPTINEYLAAVQKITEQGRMDPNFILSRTHILPKHFIMLMEGQSSGSSEESQPFSLNFVESIFLPTHSGEITILGHFSSPLTDVTAWWNPKTKIWMGSITQSRTSIVYLNPFELISIYTGSESTRNFPNEQFLAGPIFLNPETGEPSRFYYPEYSSMRAVGEVQPEQLKLAKWTYIEILHSCVWLSVE